MAEKTSPPARFYWLVVLNDGTQVRFQADWLMTTAAGGIEASNGPKSSIVFAVAAGQWKYAGAASHIDGRLVAVEHWDKPKR